MSENEEPSFVKGPGSKKELLECPREVLVYGDRKG